MPKALYIGGMPKVWPSSGTIGTISRPTLGSFINVCISATQASVVDWPLPDGVPWCSRANDSGLGGTHGEKSVLRNGWVPPSAERRSRRYFISELSSGGL